MTPSMPTQIDREHPIPDTQVFGLRESHRGFRINRLCSSLTDAANRARYKAGEEAYLDEFKLSPEEKALVLARDFSGLLAAGGNIFYLVKLGGVTGNPIYHMGAQMRGESYEQFIATRNQGKAV
jgi:protocatechuate 4,5-dioxygenase alpha chain